MPPAVVGTAAYGQRVSAATGTWSGHPTYSYQWQRCDSSGASCTTLAGVTAGLITLGTADVGHTIRTIVTARNSAGSASVRSAPTAVVSGPTTTTTVASAPTTTTTVASAPTTTTTTIAASVPTTTTTVATTPTTTTTVATTPTTTTTVATTPTTPTTVATPPAGPVAAFTASPASSVTGQAVSFDASGTTCPSGPCSFSWADDPPGGGSWPLGTGSAVSFTFQGAGTKYVTLTVTDGLGRTASVEHDEVVTTATGTSGSGSGSGTGTGTGTGSGTGTGTGTGSGSGTGTFTGDCFSSFSACGYPDPSAGNVGASCSSLPAWSPSNLPAGAGSVGGHQVTITASNVTISGYNIGDYFFYVEGSHFTLNNDCISFNANDWAGGYSSATTVWGTGGSSYLTVTNSTIVSQGCSSSAVSVCTGSGANQTLITSGGAPDATIENDVLAGAVEDLNSIGSNSTIQGNYIVANGAPGAVIHSEALFEQDVTGLIIDHNVLLNPMNQSAVIFGQVGSSGAACDNQFTITNNIIAGGGWPLSLCTHAGSAGSSSMTITGNHFLRCTASSTGYYAGGDYCGSTAPSSGSSVGAGADTHGYWPNSGFFGLTDAMYCTASGWTWSSNVWDDNGAATSCT